ncbi:MAG: hypothetical protein H6999_09260 [Hahellaceae bacterium]|nr:hypothetical protein [Hahellaceae bacterium]
MIQIRRATLLFGLVCSFPVMAEPPLPFAMCYEDKQLLPYFVGEGKAVPDTHPGVAIEVLRLMAQERPEIALSFRREPWKRCLAMLEVGEVSGVIASYKQSRHKIGVYPMQGDEPDSNRAFEITRYCLYTKVDSGFRWNGQRFEHLPELPVAVPLGYSIGDLFQNNHIGMTGVNSGDQGFFLLSHDRVAATATLCESGNQILASHPEYQDIKANPVPLRVKGSYLLVSHPFYDQHSALVLKLWDTIVSINQRFYQEIYQKYAKERD